METADFVLNLGLFLFFFFLVVYLLLKTSFPGVPVKGFKKSNIVSVKGLHSVREYAIQNSSPIDT